MRRLCDSRDFFLWARWFSNCCRLYRSAEDLCSWCTGDEIKIEYCSLLEVGYLSMMQILSGSSIEVTKRTCKSDETDRLNTPMNKFNWVQVILAISLWNNMHTKNCAREARAPPSSIIHVGPPPPPLAEFLDPPLLNDPLSMLWIPISALAFASNAALILWILRIHAKDNFRTNCM